MTDTTKPAKRFRAAIAAQGGACNSLAVANALVDAIREAREANGGDFRAADRDPAVRLIAHQLAFLLTVSELDMCRNYTEAVDACEAAQS